MEHLDREEEEEDGGEANANARNKAITSLLKVTKPRNHNTSNHAAPVESEEEESDDEDPPPVGILPLCTKSHLFLYICSHFTF